MRFILLSGFLSCVFLAGCQKSSKEEAPSVSPSPEASASATPANTAASSTSPSPDLIPRSAAPQAPPPPQPPLPLPVMTVQPSLGEVQGAFFTALSATYKKTPASPEREKWMSGEVSKIKVMVVSACSVVPLGTPSVCQVRFNNQPANVKVILTQSGWQLTN